MFEGQNVQLGGLQADWRSGAIPGVGAYLVLPAFNAAIAASLIWSGVSKSGSPAANPQTSSPAACRAFAFASIARVGDGETFNAQFDRRGMEDIGSAEMQCASEKASL